ncbi:MAG: calcium-binding protein [Candidatus Levybacteria bacterium]|nr:calcium-binding protein [Candidatus Levybacteria bacterium]
MEEQTNQNNKTGSSKVGLAIVGIIVIAFIGIFAYQSQTMTQNTTTSPQSNPTTTSESTGTNVTTNDENPTQEGTYKDGKYTAVGNYTSPGGEEELGVTLTVASGVVTDAIVEVKATRPISKARQTDFAANYKTQVIGKNIDEIQLTKVSGSSLSPKGFNDAVTQIKAEAQS